jgi:tripartite-type tricarboxylate transporter receptor subunit TctC
MKLLLAIFLLWPVAAVAQPSAYPAKPVKIVVNFAAGGMVDVIGRSLAQKMSETLGQPVVVENRPGAGGNIGAELVAKSAPDGYTLLMSSGPTLTTNPHLYGNTGFDALGDLVPITEAARIPMLLVVKASLPVSSAGEFIAYLKANPGKLTYGSAGNGTGPHMAGAMLSSLAGTPLVHVPYKGSGPAMNDLLGGTIDFMFDSGGALSHMRAGKIKLLAVGSPTRLQAFPETPTLREAGLDDYHYDSAHLLAAPRGTPKDIVDRLNREAVKALRAPEVMERIQRSGPEIIANTPEQAAASIRAEHQRIGALVKQAGIRIE